MTERATTNTRRLLAVGGLAGAMVAGLCVSSYGKGNSAAAAAQSATTARASVSAAPVSLSQIPFAVVPPKIAGVAPLPGPVAKPADPSSDMGILSVTPDQGAAGTPISISGRSLPADASVELTWSTAEATWLLQPEADTVNYRGRASVDLNVVLANTKTDGEGNFDVKLKVPEDWGGVHDIYAVVNGKEQAHGGFLTTRSVTVTPRSGPVGTPVHITYSGLGSSLYTGGASLLYDNHFVGELMANWTRGTAETTIRASGPVGPHTIQVGNAITYLYLNVPQSPIPYTNGATVTFDVTKDAGPPPASISWPVNVTPTVSARTTLGKTGLAITNKVTATLASTRGPVDSEVALQASGFVSSAPVKLVWSTVVGNRVNCNSTCWAFASTPLGTATPSSGSLRTDITVPDGLGGWHVVQLSQNGKLLAQVPFYVEESIVGRGVSSLVVKQGQEFTIHVKGVGWTQLDNTVGVDYDNSYMGYGCGFNSNGDVVVHLHATGQPGTHLIDMYPMLYSLSPSFAGTPYGMVPVLSYARDEPALALGYRLPSLHFAITVVK